MDIFNDLLRAQPDTNTIDTLADWWPGYQALARRWLAPMDAAIAGGFAADRMAWAFCSGYQAALRQMVPNLAATSVSSLCATEQGGNSPKAIQTTLVRDGSGYRVNGQKMWSLIGPGSSTFLVVVREVDAVDALAAGDTTLAAGRPQLRVVRIASDAAGVSLSPNTTRFVPEATHAKIQFDSVRVTPDQVLEGDGYSEYLKPFRTIEDILVQSALLAWLFREARLRAWPSALRERLLATLSLFKSLAQRPALDPATHILLAGALTQAHEAIELCHEQWQQAPEADIARERWLRDRSLFGIAGSIRAQRLARAWEDVAQPRTARAQ